MFCDPTEHKIGTLAIRNWGNDANSGGTFLFRVHSPHLPPSLVSVCVRSTPVLSDKYP
jgi:hypothetical protein